MRKLLIFFVLSLTFVNVRAQWNQTDTDILNAYKILHAYDSTMFDGDITMAVTSPTAGRIMQNGNPLFHTFKVVGVEFAENLFVGDSSGNFGDYVQYGNLGIGARTLKKVNAGYFNAALGVESLSNLTDGTKNVALGHYAGFSNVTGSGNVFLGFRAGYAETGSNKLYIANDSTSTSRFVEDPGVLIFGDFANRYINIYNKLAIGTAKSPAYALEVVGEGYFSNDLWINDTARFIGEGNILTSGGDLNINTGSGKVDCLGDLSAVGITMTDPTDWLDQFRKKPFYYTEIFSNAQFTPWAVAAISSGTLAQSVGSAEHPGVCAISSSTTTNSGYYAIFSITSFLGMQGGEVTECIIYNDRLDSTTVRFGYHDATSITAPVDGVYFESATDSKLYGVARTTNSETKTGTYYTLTVDTWYRYKLVVNSAANRVDYYCYNMAGTELWTDYLTTNIPTASGTGHGLVATKTTSGTGGAVSIVLIDYLMLQPGTLTR